MKLTSFPLFKISNISMWVQWNSKEILINDYNIIDWNNSGAEGLTQICRKLIKEKKRDINILLPNYFCGQTLKYLRDTVSIL